MTGDPYEGRENERPTWDQADRRTLPTGHPTEHLSDLAYAQVAQATNVQIICELVALLHANGIESKLRPGFAERVGRHVAGTRFLYDDESEHSGGSYLIWVEEMTPERLHPGVGTRWQRMEGPRRQEAWQFYEVVKMNDELTTLEPITEAGERRPGKLQISAKTDYLRREIGWKLWVPPNDLIENVGGREA